MTLYTSAIRSVLPIVLASCSAFAVEVAPYYPLQAGDYWDRLEDGREVVRYTVLSGVAYVNGIPTIQVQRSTDLSVLYYTNDANGVRLHKDVYPDSYDGVTITYSPPAVIARQHMDIGTGTSSSGQALVSFTGSVYGGLGSHWLGYSSSTMVLREELVSVPLGTFRAIVIASTTTISGYIQGVYFRVRDSENVWLTEEVGVVKLQADGDVTVGSETEYVSVIQALTATNRSIVDTDGDGIVNLADPDDDGDGVADTIDLFPLDPSESADSDGDGVGDNADAFPNDPTETLDTDSDGVGDNRDRFPSDPTEHSDNDNDGVGDNSDPDDDNDGMPDAYEQAYGLGPLTADAADDADDDGWSNLKEYLEGTAANDDDSDDDGRIDSQDPNPLVDEARVIVIINAILVE